MVEFFADSLVNGFLQSSMMGKFIVMVQLSASVVMVGIIIGKDRDQFSSGSPCNIQQGRRISPVGIQRKCGYRVPDLDS